MPKFKKPSDIKVGVIGYGGAFNMGRQHLNEMKRAGMTPTTVAEIDPSRLKVAQKDFPGIETYTSVANMFKNSDVNLVVIITPHNTHAKLALQCLKAGRHVVCEKPLAITTPQCDAMINIARKNRLVVSTYHNRHWDGCIMQAVRQIKQKKLIGDIVRIEAHMGAFRQPGNWWRTSKSISGGILYDWGVHLLEYTLQLIDSDIVEVSGFAKTGVWADKTVWKKDTNEDEGFLTVRYADGIWSTLCVTQLDCNPKREGLEITGTKGTYIMGFLDWEIITRKANGNEVITKGKNPDDQSWQLYQNIADHLTSNAPLVITGEWSRRPIHILHLADQSAKNGKTQAAKYK